MSSPLSLLSLLIPAGCTANKSVTTSAIDHGQESDVLTSDAAVEQEAQIIATTSIEQDAAITGKVVGTLFLYEASIGAATMQRYNELLVGGTIEAFSTRTELVTKLQEYGSIDHLVLFTHGDDGALYIPEPGVTDTYIKLDAMVALFNGIAPKVKKSLVLDGCNIGNNPSQLIYFKDLFQVPELRAWNFFHVLNLVSATNFTGNETEEFIRQLANAPDQYLMSNSPGPADLVGLTGNHTMLYEWFRLELDESPIGLSPDPKTIYTRDSRITMQLTKAEASIMDQLTDGFLTPSYLVEVIVKD